MTTYEEELAALLALDALEPDEQADAELRLGTFSRGFDATNAALAEGVTATPPDLLREKVLAAALDRRGPGRPVDAPAVCEPADAFDRTVAEFDALLRSLTADEWEAVAHAEHGRVRELVAHLIGVERLSARWLRGDPDVPVLHDHVASTRDVVDALSTVDAGALAQIWSDAAADVARAAADGDPDREVTFHDLTMSVGGYLVTRTFELWAHGMDIALATGRPMPALDDERMALMSSRLMGVVAEALAYRRRAASGRTARFILTGPAGGCYTVPLAPGDTAGEPDFVLVADVVDICRVAARRLRPDDLDVRIDGDRELADLVLAGIDAFARD
jgi:uncharacterized protein (TIGR03083 family)